MDGSTFVPPSVEDMVEVKRKREEEIMASVDAMVQETRQKRAELERSNPFLVRKKRATAGEKDVPAEASPAEHADKSQEVATRTDPSAPGLSETLQLPVSGY